MTLLEEIAQQRTNDVVYSAISLTIEKLASEITRELLKEPAFKEELKALARRSLSRAFRDLHTNGRKKGGAR
jgi:pantoate kinase